MCRCMGVRLCSFALLISPSIFQSADWTHSLPSGSLPRVWYSVSLYTHKQLLIMKTPKAFHYVGIFQAAKASWASGTWSWRLIPDKLNSQNNLPATVMIQKKKKKEKKHPVDWCGGTHLCFFVLICVQNKSCVFCVCVTEGQQINRFTPHN